MDWSRAARGIAVRAWRAPLAAGWHTPFEEILGTCVFLLALTLASALPARAAAQLSGDPDTVVVQSGALKLRALLWRPPGRGPFPAVLLNHGSGRSREELARLGPYEQQADALGPVFARHGYVFLYLFRRGVGLSADQGTNSVDLLNSELAAHGQEARNALQLQLLENSELSDAHAGLVFLRALPEVDSNNIAVIGHSFGGSLTLLLAEREDMLRAVVVFACAGHSWDRSTKLRARLLAAVSHTSAPVFFIQSANDYSVAPVESLSAEMERLGKAHRVKIYPPVGQTADEGHAFLYLRVDAWEPDVFGFLDGYMRQ